MKIQTKTNHPNVLAKSEPVPKGMSCTKPDHSYNFQ